MNRRQSNFHIINSANRRRQIIRSPPYIRDTRRRNSRSHHLRIQRHSFSRSLPNHNTISLHNLLRILKGLRRANRRRRQSRQYNLPSLQRTSRRRHQPTVARPIRINRPRPLISRTKIRYRHMTPCRHQSSNSSSMQSRSHHTRQSSTPSSPRRRVNRGRASSRLSHRHSSNSSRHNRRIIPPRNITRSRPMIIRPCRLTPAKINRPMIMRKRSRNMARQVNHRRSRRRRQ